MTTTTFPTLRASTAARLARGEKVRLAILASIDGAKAMLAMLVTAAPRRRAAVRHPPCGARLGGRDGGPRLTGTA
jgi:hypothetical protein